MLTDKTNKNITIRPATLKDVKQLAEIAKLTFPLACPPTAQEKNLTPYINKNLNEGVFENYINNKKDYLLIAQIDHRIAGFGLLQDIHSDETELSRLYLLPDYHGLGIGTQIANKLIQFATEKEISYLTLCVYKHNNKAKNLYENLGFVYKEEYKFIMGDEIHDDKIFELKI